jgi:hypothetical protein
VGNPSEYAPWSLYTRHQPPAEWELTGQVQAYTAEQQIMNTAVHESGHAVAYLAHGLEVSSVAVHDPDADSGVSMGEVDCVPASGPMLSFVLPAAAGERAEDRWMRENGLWTSGRAWATERHAWMDRRHIAGLVSQAPGRELTFGVSPDSWSDHAWITTRVDEVLDPLWDRVLTLADYLAKHRYVTGDEAARIAGFDH